MARTEKHNNKLIKCKGENCTDDVRNKCLRFSTDINQMPVFAETPHREDNTKCRYYISDKDIK